MFISKKILYTVGVGALLVFGIFVGGFLEKEKVNAPVEQAAAVVNAKADVDNLARVVRVVDGDTIKVEINGKVESVRYIGIDTPETVDPRKLVQCFGVEASKKNKELVEGKMVRLEKDITDRDKYHRLLRYIWLDDMLVNETLVAEGFARVYTYPPNVKYQNRFIAAEAAARVGARGLWTSCAHPTL